MTNTEKVKKIRDITLSPFKDINEALAKANGDVDAAIKLLVEMKQTDARDMANRVANNSIVYSYVHNNRIGAMIVLSCQTDFVAKNELFLALAKDICMHIVSAPITPLSVSIDDIPTVEYEKVRAVWLAEVANKSEQIREKIIAGKRAKFFSEVCLLNQKFIKDDTKTIEQLIASVSATLGEKVELKKFVRFSSSVI
jgi:elongation factor Ts